MSSIRVSDLTLTDTLAGQLQSQQASINALDAQLSSGKAILQPSDNPIGTVDSLAYQSQITQLSAVSSAAQTASTWLGLGNQTVNSVMSVMQSARTLMVQALNSGTQTQASYQAISQQAQGYISQLAQLANTTYAGTAIFAGTAGVQAPYSPTGAYSGNQQSFTITVGPGAPTAVSVPGPQLFGGGTSGVQSVFTTLQSFVAHLSAGPSAGSAAINGDLNALDANLTQAGTAATTLGQSTDAVQTAATAATNTSTQLQSELATTMDVNVATAGTQLQTELASYQAALYAVSQTVPESLATFLH